MVFFLFCQKQLLHICIASNPAAKARGVKNNTNCVYIGQLAQYKHRGVQFAYYKHRGVQLTQYKHRGVQLAQYKHCGVQLAQYKHLECNSPWKNELDTTGVILTCLSVSLLRNSNAPEIPEQEYKLYTWNGSIGLINDINYLLFK